MANFPFVSVSSHFRNSQKRFNKHEFRTKSMQKKNQAQTNPKGKKPKRLCSAAKRKSRRRRQFRRRNCSTEAHSRTTRSFTGAIILLFSQSTPLWHTTIPIHPAFWIDHEPIHSNGFLQCIMTPDHSNLFHVGMYLWALKHSTFFCNA
jgi:hypothetical protein